MDDSVNRRSGIGDQITENIIETPDIISQTIRTQREDIIDQISEIREDFTG